MRILNRKFEQLTIEKLMTRLPSMLARIYSDDVSMQLHATNEFYNFLSKGPDLPPYKEIVESGVVPQLVMFLTRADFPKLQSKAARVLATIAYGPKDITMVIVQNGAIPAFVRLLTSASEDVCEMSIWALGNIASEGRMFRDLILQHNALEPLQYLLNPNSRSSILRMATWTLSKLWWGEPEPFFEETTFTEPYTDIDFCYLSVLLLHQSSSSCEFPLQHFETQVSGEDCEIIGSITSLWETTINSRALSLEEIQILIWEQTRYAGAFLDQAVGGQVMGVLSYKFDNVIVKCNDVSRGLMIDTEINNMCNMSSDALFILLVDNDNLYVELDRVRFWDRYRCVIVNISGRPSVFTWLFVWKMKIELKLPVVAFVDFSPYSLKKLTVYGSNNVTYDVKWLGIRPSDLEKYVPESVRVRITKKMTKEEWKKCKQLQNEDFVAKDTRRFEELKWMIDNKVKLEMQVLYGMLDFDYLTNKFLPDKLRNQDWL